MQITTRNEKVLSCDMIIFDESGDYYAENPEIFSVVQGGIYLPEKNEPLKRGSVFFLSQNKYRFGIDDRCILIRISIDPQFLFFQFPLLFDFSSAYCTLENPEKVFENIVEYANLTFTETLSVFRTNSLSFYLLEKFEDFIKGNISKEKTASKKHSVSKDILNFIDNNYFRDISSGLVSEYFSISPQYLAGIMKKSTGTSFNKYLSDIKIRKGISYYKHTSLSQEEIINLLFIKDEKVFTDKIKNTQRLKEEFADKPKVYSILNKVTSLTYIFNYDPSDKSMTKNVTENKIHISNGESSYIFPVWKQLINLGYAVYFDNRQTFNQLITLQEKIGFQYGRLCRIFDLLVSYHNEKQIIYDYNRIFRILDVIIENNMYPFIELGNKRLRIQLNIQNSLVPDVPEGHQEYFEYLLEILPGFICSCINRYGYDSISNWKFEVSAPEYESADTNVNFSLTKYIHYFCKIKSCIQKLAPKCMVGGPGFNNWDSPEIFDNLLDFLKVNNAMPDFITVYMYPLKKVGYTLKLSEDPNLMENRMKLLQKSLSSKRIKTELWITEFNSNLSSRNLINDSSYQATFIAKIILAAARQKIRGAGYYLMSDEPLRYADTAKFLFGGWGLFTDKSSPKPSFHALSMLSRLGTKLEKLSDKYIVTSKPDGSFQILIYHYEHLTEEYCDKNASVQDFSYPEKIFVKNNADSWNITFSDIPSGYYLIKEYSVTPVKGNILYQWSNLHFIMPIKEETQKTLEKLSSITPALSCVRVTPDIPLTLNYILSRQHLKLITVQRQNTTDDYERNINHD